MENNKKKVMVFSPFISYPYSFTNRQNRFDIKPRKESIRSIKKTELGEGLSLVMITIFLTFFGLAFIKGLDTYIENQDRMLCHSARVSGNDEYLRKCQCFYKGEDIRCLQKE